MRTLNGYRLLVVASRKRKPENTVWHYSTGNDDSVCGKGAGADCTGYINTDDAPKYKGCCQACARYVGKHGDYEGWDDVNNVRFLSITNPKTDPGDMGFMETEEIPAHLVMHYGASQNACGADSERRTTFFPGVDCDTCLDNARTAPEFLWNAEDIPAGWESGTHRSNSDYDAAMSWPQTFYRGADGQNARMVLVSKLREYSTFNHVVQSGESQMYLDAASSIADGAMNVRIHGRIYRIRRGVPVNQTYGKGL